MKTTKKEYIAAHPHSYLAKVLSAKDWSDDQPILVGSGLIAPNTKSSNLYRALGGKEWDEQGRHRYIVGGKAGKRATQGYWFAVKLGG